MRAATEKWIPGLTSFPLGEEMFAAEEPENSYINIFMGTTAKWNFCFLMAPVTQHSGWLLF